MVRYMHAIYFVFLTYRTSTASCVSPLQRSSHTAMQHKYRRYTFELQGTIRPSLSVDSPEFVKTIAVLSVVSAPLGTLLDNYHGLFGVLSYNPNAIPYQITSSIDGKVLVKSAAFVPVLFSVAGAVMAVLQLRLGTYGI